MKILVTGGAGFIGSSLVDKLLPEGHQVSVLDEFNDFYDPAIKRANVAAFAKHAPIYEADIRDGAAVDRIVREQKPDAIIHLAARARQLPLRAEAVGLAGRSARGLARLLASSGYGRSRPD